MGRKRITDIMPRPKNDMALRTAPNTEMIGETALAATTQPIENPPITAVNAEKPIINPAITPPNNNKPSTTFGFLAAKSVKLWVRFPINAETLLITGSSRSPTTVFSSAKPLFISVRPFSVVAERAANSFSMLPINSGLPPLPAFFSSSMDFL